VITYGAFINDVITFLIVAFVIFLIVKAVNKNKKLETVPSKNCPYCRSSIPLEATRCSGCTSELPATELAELV
jgi:large conductance mechanosensitive channel